MDDASGAPVWAILMFMAGISTVTLIITIMTNKTQGRHLSSQIVSDMLKTTREFRGAVDSLLDGRDTEEDRDDLMRLMSYLELLALCRQDNLAKPEYVRVVYGPILRKLTDGKIKEVMEEKDDLFVQNPKLFKRMRGLREELVGS